MKELPTTRVLLVEDDEDDFLLTRELLAEIKGRKFTIEWARTFEAGLKAMTRNSQDICLIDYRLGAENGLELLSAARTAGAEAPVILLTGQGQEEVDLAAMKAGAADYLVKGRVAADQLDRTFRYAIERKRAAAVAAFEQARLAAFGAEIGLALTRRASLNELLENCAAALVQFQNAALAQIWTYDAKEKSFTSRAGAGPVWDAAGSVLNLPPLKLNAEKLARGESVFIPDLARNRSFEPQAWAGREKLASFAAYPLMLEEGLVGCVSLFTREPLRETILPELGSVANGIALCIQRKQSEVALEASESRYRALVENLKEVVFQTNEFGQWSFLNPAWSVLTGYAVEATLGKSCFDGLHPDDRARTQAAFVQLINREITHACHEVRLVTRDGDVRWAELILRLTLDGAGAVVGATGSMSDITDRKLAEASAKKPATPVPGSRNLLPEMAAAVA